MLIQYNGGNIIFECDHCGDPLDTKTRDPDKAVAIFVDEAWRIVTAAPDSPRAEPDQHYCQTCPMKRAIIR